jgi:CRP-like cAMP-binding protein
MFKRNPFARIGREPGAPGDLVGLLAKYADPQRVSFQPGDVLRQKNVHYRDMLLTTAGQFEVDFEAEGAPSKLLITEPATPVGEIGFLRGTAASATVKALSSGAAIVIDDNTLEKLERDEPTVASQFLRRLAQVAEERISFNLVTTPRGPAYAKNDGIEVLICRTDEMLQRAQRLRYEVYCEELGRKSPYADHQQRIITDELDSFGNTFIAIKGDELLGTLRTNEASLGALGILEELYGMNKSIHHPGATAICTKFVVRKSKRGGATAFKLISAVVRYGLRRQVKECYIDCVPSLLPYYKAMGFVSCGQRFLHRENGPSDPLLLDLQKHGKRLGSEMGPISFLAFYLRAQSHKLMSRFAPAGSRVEMS